MAVLISKMQERIKYLESYVKALKQEIQIQDQIIETHRKMTEDYERKIDILEEILRISNKDEETIPVVRIADEDHIWVDNRQYVSLKKFIEATNGGDILNAIMAQGSDRVSTSATADSTVEGAVPDSELPGEGSHT